MEILILIVAVIFAAGLYNAHVTAKRRAALTAKYHDAEIVERIMNKTLWQGETAEQLTDSLGQPIDVDEKVMKEKIRRTWKYRQTGKNRYGLRVILENGVVVGWEQKG